jgi:hypothetical protein
LWRHVATFLIALFCLRQGWREPPGSFLLRRACSAEDNPDKLQRSCPTGDTNERDLKLTLELNRAQRSRLHLSILRGFGISAEETEVTADAAKKQAFAEAIAWHGSGEIADIATLFALADAIDFHAYQAVHHSDRQFAEISADELRDVHGASTVNLVLKLAGYHPRQRGRKMVWTDASNGEPTVPVCLPVDLLEQWNSE